MHPLDENKSIMNNVIVLFCIIVQVYWSVSLTPIGYGWLLSILMFSTILIFLGFLTSFFIYYLVNIVYAFFAPKQWIEMNSNYLIVNPICLESKHEPYKINGKDVNSAFLAVHRKPATRMNSLEQTELIYSINGGEYNLSAQTGYSWSRPSDKNYIFDSSLPIIMTIQIPVYTEDFNTVLKPTIEQMCQACNWFNKNNNKCQVNIMICEDGLQVIDDEEQKKRIEYYDSVPYIFYIARPKANREGKFKKASNLNSCVNMVEYINERISSEKCNPMSPIKSLGLWTSLINDIKIEWSYMMSTKPRTFSMGTYVMIVDSDTRIDYKCLPLLLYEIKNYKNVAFLQIKTSAIEDSGSHWEHVITHFTNDIYNIAFLYSGSIGNSAPLVGHNCILNWSLIKKMFNVEKTKKVLFVPSPLQSFEESRNELLTDDIYTNIETAIHQKNYVTYWNETKVSEDFAMSLFIQMNGYIGKYVYFDCDFKEGVTLTFHDEVIKFCKYAFGIHELILHPFKDWIKKGIFQSSFIQLISTPNLSYGNKYAIFAYMGSYYAISLSPIFTLLNVLLYNELQEYIWSSYLQVLIGGIFLFYGCTPLINIGIKYKHGLYNSMLGLVYNEYVLGWQILLFFTSLQYQFLKTLTYYMFSIPMSWKTTNKTMEKKTIWNNLSSVFDNYWDQFAWSTIMLLGSILTIYYYNTIILSFVPLCISSCIHIITPIFYYCME